MKEDGLGRLFVRQLVMAIPWGIVFLLVMIVAAAGIKQQVKEGMQYGISMAVHEASGMLHNPRHVASVKRNIKKGLQYGAAMVRYEVRALLTDPVLKQDVKEALEFSSEKLR
jgi:hypothetical protein